MPFFDAHARQNAYTQTRSGSRLSSNTVPVRTVNIFLQPRQRQRKFFSRPPPFEAIW